MSLFRHSLDPLESIAAWEREGVPSLSWFALTLGRFWIELGAAELFRYTPAILAHWAVEEPHPDYQVAAFARDILGSAGPALAPLPSPIAKLVEAWPSLRALRVDSLPLAATRTPSSVVDNNNGDAHETDDAAWAWLRERSPWTSYLTACPSFSFFRLGDCVRIAYDNRSCLVDNLPVWTAEIGYVDVSTDQFRRDLSRLADQLIEEMRSRIDALESGRARCQVPLDIAELRAQHIAWQREFEGYLAPHSVDRDWDATIVAIRAWSDRRGLKLDL